MINHVFALFMSLSPVTSSATTIQSPPIAFFNTQLECVTVADSQSMKAGQSIFWCEEGTVDFHPSGRSTVIADPGPQVTPRPRPAK